MAQYDLTAKLGQFFDLHLVFPLLEFLSSKEVSLLTGADASRSPLMHLVVCLTPISPTLRFTMKGSFWKES